MKVMRRANAGLRAARGMSKRDGWHPSCSEAQKPARPGRPGESKHDESKPNETSHTEHGDTMNEQSREVHDEHSDDHEIIEESAGSAPHDEVDPEQQAAEAHVARLEAQLRHGANWFYWIAGLSVVNSLISLAEGDRQFIVGLGITQIVDQIATIVAQNSPDMALVAKIVAGVFTFITAGIFAGFGLGSSKRLSWVFIVGMVFYGIDGLLYLVIGEWLSFGFHIFVLTRLFSGFKACRELNSLVGEAAAQVA